ncbi:hypothetical protein [Sphingopyxis sp. GW247-27LB]|uniref:hypothetical protein n=1 Tax=Sphingopyxis sp. GW247-27LB TaxID=2012632 RepID=UPI000BA5F63F|nr:hypothetical protein [Sphingopyxis sp. GW247-27LB]PAL20218.1 hypothetical protein CD928_17575 [Sphingopyxis sp. GW247-27LB]
MTRRPGILEQVRSEAWSDGFAQANMLVDDDAWWAGWTAAEAAAPSRLVWFILGAVAGVLAIVLVNGVWA